MSECKEGHFDTLDDNSCGIIMESQSPVVLGDADGFLSDGGSKLEVVYSCSVSASQDMNSAIDSLGQTLVTTSQCLLLSEDKDQFYELKCLVGGQTACTEQAEGNPHEYNYIERECDSEQLNIEKSCFTEIQDYPNTTGIFKDSLSDGDDKHDECHVKHIDDNQPVIGDVVKNVCHLKGFPNVNEHMAAVTKIDVSNQPLSDALSVNSRTCSKDHFSTADDDNVEMVDLQENINDENKAICFIDYDMAGQSFVTDFCGQDIDDGSDDKCDAVEPFDVCVPANTVSDTDNVAGSFLLEDSKTMTSSNGDIMEPSTTHCLNNTVTFDNGSLEASFTTASLLVPCSSTGVASICHVDNFLEAPLMEDVAFEGNDNRNTVQEVDLGESCDGMKSVDACLEGMPHSDMDEETNIEDGNPLSHSIDSNFSNSVAVDQKYEDDCMKNYPAFSINSDSTVDCSVRESKLEKYGGENVVFLDDDGDSSKRIIDYTNDIDIVIESVSSQANEVHRMPDEPLTYRKENGIGDSDVAVCIPTDISDGGDDKSPEIGSKAQTCLVCSRAVKCKYNIVRNGIVNHLCSDACFKHFRLKPISYLQRKPGTSSPASNETVSSQVTGRCRSTPSDETSQAHIKTCVVCQLMNISSQGHFCVWKGLDFCGEGCLGKFQASVSSTCTMCSAFIPLISRFTHCLRIASEACDVCGVRFKVRPFCTSACFTKYKLRVRLCSFCQKELHHDSETFSSLIGSDLSFKDFCSRLCINRYEGMFSSDVEILRFDPGKRQASINCSVCHNAKQAKHSIRYKNVIHHLCSDACLSMFKSANKLQMNVCDFCQMLCNRLESSPHMMQFEGVVWRFCSDTCMSQFRVANRKMWPCSWCGLRRENFDMIERLDCSRKCQVFCSLNCLSLYRVNLQAKSNQAVSCDQCSKFSPAQYHLTMSDASVRNFCSYKCVMSFQSQFSTCSPPVQKPDPTPLPRHKHNTRRSSLVSQQSAGQGLSPVPVISNVISLASPEGCVKSTSKVSIKAPPASAVERKPKVTCPSVVQTAASSPLQQVIVRPPTPKQTKNKMLQCRPITHTKATLCRPVSQTQGCQTDECGGKPVLLPVPVPMYFPAPCALYAAPTPTPVFIPIPIPVPIFIPTSRKTANGILKQIKDILDKTPSDPLQAEMLAMAAAVSGDGEGGGDSDTDVEESPPSTAEGQSPLTISGGGESSNNTLRLQDRLQENHIGEDLIAMALRMAGELSVPATDLEASVDPVTISNEPACITPTATIPAATEASCSRVGVKRDGSAHEADGRPLKRARLQDSAAEFPPQPNVCPADAGRHLKYTYGVNAWQHWVTSKNAQIERSAQGPHRRTAYFKADLLQCTADELNHSLSLFVKEVRKPNGEEYSPDSVYYLTLGIQQHLFENGRVDNIFSDGYFYLFNECLKEVLVNCQPKYNSSGQMVCRIEEEHLWECKQLGAHSPYVLLNTLIYFHTKYFMLKTPDDHMRLSFAHILKYWRKGQHEGGKDGQLAKCVSLRYYSVSSAKKDGSIQACSSKKGSSDGILVYEVSENQDNPLRCPVKLYEFFMSKCPENIKNRNDIFYPIPERSCVPDSPVWYSSAPIDYGLMEKMLARVLLVREVQDAHLHAQPIYV